MTKMNWERASQRDRIRQVPPWELERERNQGLGNSRRRKKAKRQRTKRYRRLEGVDFSTYRRPNPDWLGDGPWRFDTASDRDAFIAARKRR